MFRSLPDALASLCEVTAAADAQVQGGRHASPLGRGPSGGAGLDEAACLASGSGRLAGAVRACTRLRLPLAEVLDDDSSSTAPSRLVALMSPKWKAEWVLEAKPAGGGGGGGGGAAGDAGEFLESVLRLDYHVPRGNGIIVAATQSLAEVTDFQSACVLAAKTNTGAATSGGSVGGGGGDEVAASIDAFTQQFRWAQEAARGLLELRRAGHYDVVRGVEFRVSLCLGKKAASELAQLVAETRAALTVR